MLSIECSNKLIAFSMNFRVFRMYLDEDTN